MSKKRDDSNRWHPAPLVVRIQGVFITVLTANESPAKVLNLSFYSAGNTGARQ